jgi:hypothetical protein
LGTIRAIITSPLGLGLAQIFLLAFGTIQTALAQSDPNVLEYKGTVAAARDQHPIGMRSSALQRSLSRLGGGTKESGEGGCGVGKRKTRGRRDPYTGFALIVEPRLGVARGADVRPADH